MSKNSCTARPAHSLLGMAFKFRCWFATFRKLLRSNYILDAVHHSDLKLIIPLGNYGYNLFIFISPESAKNLQSFCNERYPNNNVFFYNVLIDILLRINVSICFLLDFRKRSLQIYHCIYSSQLPAYIAGMHF